MHLTDGPRSLLCTTNSSSQHIQMCDDSATKTAGLVKLGGTLLINRLTHIWIYLGPSFLFKRCGQCEGQPVDKQTDRHCPGPSFSSTGMVSARGTHLINRLTHIWICLGQPFSSKGAVSVDTGHCTSTVPSMTEKTAKRPPQLPLVLMEGHSAGRNKVQGVRRKEIWNKIKD